MGMLKDERYRRVSAVNGLEREWPGRELLKAPIWCSVDLRSSKLLPEGTRTVEAKLELFNRLVRLGVKEIDVGAPAASQVEFDFVQQLVEQRMIPQDVRIQVRCQCQEELVERTFAAIQGAGKVLFCLCGSVQAPWWDVSQQGALPGDASSNGTSPRDAVLKSDQQVFKESALATVRLVKQYAMGYDGDLALGYSLDGFTGNGLAAAVDACTALHTAWGAATPEKPMVFHLQAVDLALPFNQYADQVEWMGCNIPDRPSVVLSIALSGDRGTGAAAAELALLAGADRVEGTLFGGGQAGHVDVMALAERFLAQGIAPGLEMEAAQAASRAHGPGGPADRHSSKGGVAFVMDTFFGFKLPRGMHQEFAEGIQLLSEQQGEVAPEQIFSEFKTAYLDKKEPLHFRNCQITDTETEPDVYATLVKVNYSDYGEPKSFQGVGNGPIDAVLQGFKDTLGVAVKVLDYNEHALSSGSNAQAVSYIHMMDQESGRATYGVGISSNITRASLRGIFSAVNRLFYNEDR